jgi:hypothetical protein
MSLSRAVSVASIFLGLLVSGALAQQSAQTAITGCNAVTRGTANCPTYTAPATTAVPSASMDGSMNLPAATSTTLFNGAVPPNAFMVQSSGYSGAICFVNDHGPANGQGVLVTGGGIAGFPLALVGTPQVGVFSFITPPGYKPIGPVSVWCNVANYVAARGW